ncbi:uncharacterized protein METZ01_LOCUS337076 [marine metagenome]|uniref:Uncharacterized protein n=1 Tax=marine metagenome TaxID=408172 RepID=A0A382QHQ3_9ZZZZ
MTAILVLLISLRIACCCALGRAEIVQDASRQIGFNMLQVED